MGESIYIGVDGGGTQCRLRLENALGVRLGESIGGPANICLSVEKSWASILAALDEALLTANLTQDDPNLEFHAGLGLAGTESEAALNAFLSQPHGFSTLILRSDAATACLGAHAGCDGAIIIVGTGSIAYAQVAGKIYRAGGEGFPQGDAGGGAWLGYHALQSDLRQILLDSNSRFQQATTPTDYASVAPHVIALAQQGHPSAIFLLKMAGQEINALYFSLIEKIGYTIPIVLLGGIVNFLKPFLCDNLLKNSVSPQYDALHGAIMLAKELSSDT